MPRAGAEDPLIGGRDCALDDPDVTLARKEKAEVVGNAALLEGLATDAEAVVFDAALLLDEAVAAVALDPRIGGRANPPRAAVGLERATLGGSGGASFDLFGGFCGSGEITSVLLFRFVVARL